MDVEAMQLLNLSPIPELSELELSTMMDQLSGLSDINGDYTDQHVENIIKEAEDLIDRSSCSKINELNVSKTSESEENKSLDINEDLNEVTENAEFDFQELHSEGKKHFNTPVNSDHLINDAYDEVDANKHFNSPVEQTPVKIFSPGGSCNHIKSTIDSLKEFSTIIEKQLSSRSPNLSPKYNKVLKHHENSAQNKEVTVLGCPVNNKSSNSRILQTSELETKKNSLEPHEKSVKLLNCFERLYQSRPVRLLACKKPKAIDKIPKTLTKKKLTKDLKNTFKSNKKKFIGDGLINAVNEDICQNISYPFPKTPATVDALNHNKTLSGYSSLSNLKCMPHSKATESKSTNELLLQNLRNYSHSRDSQNDASNVIQPKIEERLLLKVLEEVEQIKSQVKKAGVFVEGPSPERAAAEEQGVIDSLKSEVESVREKVTSVSNAGIKRLQEQFSLLKFKYYQQMDKLEAENLKLREALHCQQRFFAARRNANSNVSSAPETCVLTETRNYKISISSSPSSCEADKKGIVEVAENPPGDKTLEATTSKEAFSQTEKQMTATSVSTQCTGEPLEEGKKETETKKTENKENVTLRYKLGRSKPFSDVGIHQLMRQKKLLDHESQLLATLRGLQSEMSAKDKENRKLKMEIESLKKQIKKLNSNKADNSKKSHAGTQTIGLGPSVQKPYTPEMFEVPREFELENEDLKSRIKALEEEFEMLKEKRINDLQSLHQVHEEEMAKLVSKLETQSSLTKHLHSLLISR